MTESEIAYDGTMVMRVTALTVDPLTALPVVVLRDELGLHAVPIGVGLTDAAAIATELDGIELERPMTHQLMGDMLSKAGVSIECVVISPAHDEPCCARVHLLLPCGGRASQDARPSDAFALALHMGADIRVPLAALEPTHGREAYDAVSAHRSAPSPGCPPMVAADESADFLERLGDESFGKWKI